jgi:MFS family permease
MRQAVGPRSTLRAMNRTRWSLPAGVWLLGSVSLLNDVASESIYPLLPFFLTSVLGATAVSLGIIEGAAEAISSVLKVIAGRLSDRWRRRKPIVVVGYGLSALARPFIALATGWIIVFALRFIDRVGKGVRSAPRDAMLADLAQQNNRGRVYGFHRAMDHTGAVLGPLLATGFLIAFPRQYRTLFALTAIPGAATVLLLRWLREPNTQSRIPNPQSLTANPQSLIPDSGRFGNLPSPLRWYLVVLSIFTLGNSADAFLLLRLTESAGGPQLIPLLWSLLHIVKMVTAVIGGAASDRFGRRPLIAAGWMIYALVYMGFGLSTSMPALTAWFLVYGVYYGCAEGTERALVADFALPAQKGTAFGIYNAVAGIGALISSVLFGVIWKNFGASIAFGSGATLAALATILLFILVPASTVTKDPSTERL